MTDEESKDEEEYETWITHDPIGVTHFIRIRKNTHPEQVRCVDCDD